MRKKLLIFLGVLLLFATETFAQKTITGTVKDSEGPIPGALVQVKGTKLRTVTNASGKFKLDNVPNGATIKIQSVGLENFEQVVGSQTSFDIKMKTAQMNVIDIEDEVGDGYTTISDKRSTIAKVVIDEKQLKNRPDGQFVKAFAGIKGIQVNQGGGDPSSAPRIRIRAPNGSPLYVLDGVPIRGNAFQSLNSNDFASVVILKDARATAMYGARGADGVVVITSKRGKSGKTMFSYNFQKGISNTPKERLQSTLTGSQKIDFEQEIGFGPTFGMPKERIDSLRKIDTDWADELLRTGKLTRHELTAIGGNRKMNFFTSFSYFKQEGVVKNTALERYTSRINLRFSGRNYRFGFGLAPSYSKSNNTTDADAGNFGPSIFTASNYSSGTSSTMNSILWSNRYQRARDKNRRTGYAWLPYQSMLQFNALEGLMFDERKSNEVKVVTNLFAEYDIPKVPGLMARSKWGVDFSYRENDKFSHPYGSSYVPLSEEKAPNRKPSNTAGRLQTANNRYASFVGTNSLNYSKKFGENHQFDAGIFSEFVYLNSSSSGYSASGFTGKLFNKSGVTKGSADNPQYISITNGSEAESALVSQFADVNYSFKEKYSLSASVRRDGSSKFSDQYKYGIFWSVGAAWLLSEEEFIKSIKKISRLKLRGSYGTVGNQGNIANFGYLTLFQQINKTYDGTAGVGLSAIANDELRWESRNKLNVGMDLGLFKNRVLLETDFYEETTTDLFLSKPISRTNGFSSLLKNLGAEKNSGIEIGLTVVPVHNDNFTWEVKANFTKNKNKIVKLLEGQDEVRGSNSITRVGLPSSTYLLVPYIGIDPADGEPLFEGRNGEILKSGDIDYENDAREMKNKDATFFGGLTNTVSYKGITLSAQFSYMGGNATIVSERANVENYQYAYDGFTTKVLDRWRKPGDLATYHRFKTADGEYSNVTYNSDVLSRTTMFYEELDFIRLRDVTLSYDFPKHIAEKIKSRGVKVFVQGQNLLLFTEYSGTDPETASRYSGGVYPTLRSYSVGATIDF